MACPETWERLGVRAALDLMAYPATQDHKAKRWVLAFPGCLVLILDNWAYNAWVIKLGGGDGFCLFVF